MSVRVVDVRTGSERFRLKGFEDIVEELAFSPDANLLAAAAADGSVSLWSMKTGVLVRTLATAGPPANGVAFSPDGKLLAVGLKDATVSVLAVDDGQQRALLRGHSDEVVSVVFAPDGARLASASRDATVRLWRIEDATCQAVLRGHRDGVLAVAFSPDGTRLLSGSVDRCVRLWELRAGETPRLVAEREGHALSVTTVAFSPDGRLAASGSRDSAIRLWDAASGEPLARLYGHEDTIEGLAFAPDGAALYSASEDKTVRWWAVPRATTLPAVSDAGGEVVKLVLCQEGKQIAAGAFSPEVRLWDVATRTLTRALAGPVPPVFALDCSRDGLLAAGGADGVIRLWDMTGAPQGELSLTDTIASAAVFSPDGAVLAASGVTGRAALWDARRRTILATLPKASDTDVTGYSALAFHPRGRWLVGLAGDKQSTVWDVTTHAIVASPFGELPPGPVVFSPDAAFAACASGNDIIVQELRGAQRRVVLKGHESKVASLTFSPDSRLLASGGDDALGEYLRNDCSIRFWDMEHFKEIAVLRGHLSGVWAMVFAADGATLVSGGKDRTVRWWELGAGDLAQLQRRLEVSITAGLSYALDHNGRRVSRDAREQARVRSELASQGALPWLPEGGKRDAGLFETLAR